MEHQRKIAPSTAAVQLPPILIIDHPSRSDGRRLFEELNTEEFSKEATVRREAQSQSTKHHAGHWQAVAAAAWKALTDEERDDWGQKAKMAGSVKGNADSQENIYEYIMPTVCLPIHFTNYCAYRNQKTIGLSLFQLLKSYTGTGSRQIGNAAFHVLYGFRGKSDKLELGRYAVKSLQYMYSLRYCLV